MASQQAAAQQQSGKATPDAIATVLSFMVLVLTVIVAFNVWKPTNDWVEVKARAVSVKVVDKCWKARSTTSSCRAIVDLVAEYQTTDGDTLRSASRVEYSPSDVPTQGEMTTISYDPADPGSFSPYTVVELDISPAKLAMYALAALLAAMLARRLLQALLTRILSS